jgi:hypothetical protein
MALFQVFKKKSAAARAKAMGISFRSPASQQIPLHVERPLSIDHEGGVRQKQ